MALVSILWMSMSHLMQGRGGERDLEGVGRQAKQM